MLANFGYFALLFTFGCAVYATVMAMAAVAQRQPTWLASAHNAAILTWPLITLSALSLIGLLLTNQYQIAYVSEVTSRAMPFYLKITALWGGQAGSLVFWSWLMATFAGLAMLRKWERDRALMPWVIVVTMVTLAFFVGLVLFVENPFMRLWQVPATGEIIQAILQPTGTQAYIPADGNGLNPLLRHPGMIWHPPMLYTGFVSFVIPYAFAIAALATRRTDDEWIRTTRRWTLIGWLFLSLGLILGGRWAYDVLGWGGYWGWDPVENAAFLPWLTATAFLHSVMIQEKRGMLKKWNLILIILTYSLVIFGTFLTRSGVLSSVHAFAQSAIGPAFFIFIGVTFIFSLILLFREWEHLRDEHELESSLSREVAFLINNLLFLGIAATVFWGTVFPMISELVRNEKMTVGPPFYNRVVGPLFVALLLLMGIAPLVAWRKASAKQLGRLLWIPFVLALAVVGLLFVLGITNWMALVSLGIVAFVAFTTVFEYARGVRARMKTGGENFFTALATLTARNRRRYGGYIIHLGVIVMAVGIIGSNLFQVETQGQLEVGQQLTVGGYVILFKGVTRWHDQPSAVTYTRAEVEVYKHNTLLSPLYPRQDIYDDGQPMTIPGVRSSVEDDVYVLLANWEPLNERVATLKVYVNPLVNWVWGGGLVFILGTLVAAWPDAAETRRVWPAGVPVSAKS